MCRVKVMHMSNPDILDELERIIDDRKAHPKEGSYITTLNNDPKGIDKVLEKVGEEATEFIIAVKNGDTRRTVGESADLLFHFLIAIRSAGIDLDMVREELEKRRK
jgi:phosphoribosyl-ATP pyrophosphohydrolase